MTPVPSRSGTRPPREPIFNRLPVVVLALGGAITAASLVELYGPSGPGYAMREAAVLAAGPGYAGLDRPLGPLAPLALHVFLHVAWWHLLINMAALASFGPPTAMALGRGARGAALFLGFFFLCAVGGGLAQLIIGAVSQTDSLAVGASSALSGLLPAVGWMTGGRAGALRMSAPWALINLALAVTGMAFPLPIAWGAHIGGLIAGLVLFPVFLHLAGWRRSPWG